MQLIPIEKNLFEPTLYPQGQGSSFIQKSRTIDPDGLNIREKRYYSFPVLCFFLIVIFHFTICRAYLLFTL